MNKEITNQLKPLQQRLLNHELYIKIKSPKDLRTFMEHHVFAVWDFMSLLKTLQNKLTCTQIPWIPKGNPRTRYLINEIVLAEETDISLSGERQSHFEMYLEAMQTANANNNTILELINTNFEIVTIKEATASLPESIQNFLAFTFDTIKKGNLHEIAAIFTFGREDLIPEMFTAIIEKIQLNFPESDLTLIKYYFDRHIELDGDEHGPLALEMVNQLCDNDSKKWREVLEISKKALEIRIALWDGILLAITKEPVLA